MSTEVNEKFECCPKFDPLPWNEKTVQWENKLFIKETVKTFFYVPLNFGAVMTKLNRKVEQAGAKNPDALCLSTHTSKWSMEVLLAVNEEIPNTENVRLSGSFVSKVYEGDFKETGKWCQDFDEYCKRCNVEMKKMYMWYTTCPKCAKKYGKNYVVILGEV